MKAEEISLSVIDVPDNRGRFEMNLGKSLVAKGHLITRLVEPLEIQR